MYKYLSRLCLACVIGVSIFFTSCTMYKKVAHHIPTPEERCGYAEFPDTVPLADKRLMNVAEALSKNHSQAKDILLCQLKGGDRIVVASAVFNDIDENTGVLIIWISDNMLESGEPDVEQFIIAHEIGRYALKLADCSGVDIKQYLQCEHMIDSYTANLVSVKSAIHSLAILRDMLIEAHATTESIFFFNARIRLLRHDVLQLI